MCSVRDSCARLFSPRPSGPGDRTSRLICCPPLPPRPAGFRTSSASRLLCPPRGKASNPPRSARTAGPAPGPPGGHLLTQAVVATSGLACSACVVDRVRSEGPSGCVRPPRASVGLPVPDARSNRSRGRLWGGILRVPRAACWVPSGLVVRRRSRSTTRSWREFVRCRDRSLWTVRFGDLETQRLFSRSLTRSLSCARSHPEKVALARKASAAEQRNDLGSGNPGATARASASPQAVSPVTRAGSPAHSFGSSERRVVRS